MDAARIELASKSAKNSTFVETFRTRLFRFYFVSATAGPLSPVKPESNDRTIRLEDN